MDESGSARARGSAIFAGIIALVLTFGLSAATPKLLPPHPTYAPPADHHKYRYMAEHGVTHFALAPFCHRVGVPWIAGMLPLDVAENFSILTGLAIWACAMGMFALARAWQFSEGWAFVGMLCFFSTGWATLYPLFNFWLPDAWSMAALTWALVLLRRRVDWGFALVVAIGAAIKESTIFVAPLYLTLSATRSLMQVDRRPAAAAIGTWPRGLVKAVLLSLPAITVLVGIRLAIPARNDDPKYVAALPAELRTVHLETQAYSYSSLVQRVWQARWEHTSLRAAIGSWTVGTFGLMGICLPLLNWRANRRLVARFLPFILLVYAQLLVATDTQRLLVLALPAVILATLAGMQSLSQWLRLGPAAFVGLPILMAGVNVLHAEGFTAPIGPQAVVLGAYILVLVAWWKWNARTRQRSP